MKSVLAGYCPRLIIWANSALVFVCVCIPIFGGDLEWPWSGHRRVPEPHGMVFRVEVREVMMPWDHIEVHALDRQGPAVAVFEHEVRGSKSWPASLRIFSYPEGRQLEALSGAEAARVNDIIAAAASKRTMTPFDFDGDGVADAVQQALVPSDRGYVRIASGRDRHTLFEEHDPLEYESDDRVRMLGDLDGDGYAEIALIHPRMDRSSYDFELWDALLGAKSWVTIISGSRVRR